MQAPETAHTDSTVQKRKIFLIEDHPVFCAGLTQIINRESDLIVCGSADSAPRALAALRGADVAGAILDICLRGSDGIELIKQIRAEHPKLPLLVLSMHDENVYAMRSIRAGANGYLMKREPPEVIIAGLYSTLAGEIAVSAQFKDQLVYRILTRGEASIGSPVEVLSDRELEILNLVGRGMGSKLIAENLHLSPKTVESHRLHIKEKLKLKNAADLVRFATEWVLSDQ